MLDLVIVGAGPAGLSAAITAASEGLSLCLLDADYTLGGQARESNGIENYPGFDLITGADLMARLVAQAGKFHCSIRAGTRITRLNADPLRFECDNGETWESRAGLLAMGVSYRRYEVEGLTGLLGRGAYYGLGNIKPTAKACHYVIVGGANSAGQAAAHLAAQPRAHVTMVIRRKIDDAMSHYLVERLRGLPNVVVLEGSEVVSINQSNGRPSTCGIAGPDGLVSGYPCDSFHIFIGAEPKTHWLRPLVRLNARGFIETTGFATSVPGLYAAGDVRLGSVKRVAAAVGEGAAAISAVHEWLD